MAASVRRWKAKATSLSSGSMRPRLRPRPIERTSRHGAAAAQTARDGVADLLSELTTRVEALEEVQRA